MKRTEQETVWDTDGTEHRMFHRAIRPLIEEEYRCSCGWNTIADWHNAAMGAFVHLDVSDKYQLPDIRLAAQ